MPGVESFQFVSNSMSPGHQGEKKTLAKTKHTQNESKRSFEKYNTGNNYKSPPLSVLKIFLKLLSFFKSNAWGRPTGTCWNFVVFCLIRCRGEAKEEYVGTFHFFCKFNAQVRLRGNVLKLFKFSQFNALGSHGMDILKLFIILWNSMPGRGQRGISWNFSMLCDFNAWGRPSGIVSNFSFCFNFNARVLQIQCLAEATKPRGRLQSLIRDANCLQRRAWGRPGKIS